MWHTFAKPIHCHHHHHQTTCRYVCEELGAMKDDYLEQEQVNSILTAVAQGMRREEANAAVRLAATTALYNALEFAHTNFDNEQERNYLMQVCDWQSNGVCVWGGGGSTHVLQG